MNRTLRYLLPPLLLLMTVLLTACPESVHEQIKQSTQLTPLSEATHAVDVSLQIAVEANIKSDPELKWYALTYGFNVEVSHSVVTVHMTVKTEELRDRALGLVGYDARVREVVDEIEVDPTIEGAPFEW